MDAGQLVLFMVLAFIVTEGTVEYLLGVPFDKIEKLSPYKWTLMYVSAGLGIFVAIWYSVDMLALLGLPASVVGQVFTGVLLGRGANFINDLWQRFFPAGNGRSG